MLSLVVEGTPDDRVLIDRLGTMLREAPQAIGALWVMKLPAQRHRCVWAWVERQVEQDRLRDLEPDDRAWFEAVVEARANPERFRARFTEHLGRLKLNHRGALAARLLVIGVPPSLEPLLRRYLGRLAPHERDRFAELDLACRDALEALGAHDLPGAARALRALAHWARSDCWVVEPIRQVLRRARAHVSLRAPVRDVTRPMLWFKLESRRGDEHVLSALRDIGLGLIAQGRYSEFFFPGPEVADALMERARPILDELTLETPRRFITSHDRLRTLERQALRAIGERPRRFKALFRAFVDELAFESYPGNFLGLLRAVIDQGLEHELCHRALAIAVETEWRDWVRPELLVLKRAFDRKRSRHLKARSGRRRRR
ncbi:MAG: hypothetical protein SFW67_19175 [Myxococcaceae bacterium]|nr:hypothetical protein [Myxococcaceae bacterium]